MPRLGANARGECDEPLEGTLRLFRKSGSPGSRDHALQESLRKQAFRARAQRERNKTQRTPTGRNNATDATLTRPNTRNRTRGLQLRNSTSGCQDSNATQTH